MTKAHHLDQLQSTEHQPHEQSTSFVSIQGTACPHFVACAVFVSTVLSHSIILVQWHLMSSQDDDETL